jgi:hypothetical protein
VVAMAWSVHARQIKLAEQLARRQFLVTQEASANGNGVAEPGVAELNGANGAAASRRPAPLVIDGPDTVVTGDQARYRVRANGNQKVVSWAAGGTALAQAPDPTHPDELLLVADRPGNLTVTVWVREGMNERRATKPITAVPEVTPATPPFTLRLFLHAWGLIVVAVLIIGFAGALAALGDLTSADFIALVTPLAALLGVIAVVRSPADQPGRPAAGQDLTRPSP